MRRRRVPAFARRRRVWATVATVSVAAVALFSFVASQGRAEAATRSSARAVSAIQAARSSEAGRWATDELAAAEESLRLAEIERRRQDIRWLLSDYATAETLWRDAEARAGGAVSLAVERRQAAEAGARESIAAAEVAVAASGRLSASIYAGAGQKAALSEARLRLNEAQIHLRNGDFTHAAQSADLAFALTQRTDAHTTAAVARYADDDQVETWQRWKRETIEWSRTNRQPAIVVAKEQHRVTLYVNGSVHRVYDADLGFNWVADKLVSGDGATPEGRYRVVQEKRGGATIYYKALLLDYPNALDRREFSAALRAGQISRRAAIGGLIEIHGEGGRGQDWTKGCVALTNRDMDELMRMVRNGTPVTIIGSDGRGALAALAGETKPRGLER